MLSGLQPDTKNLTPSTIAVDPAILYMGTPVVLISSLNRERNGKLGTHVFGMVARVGLHARLEWQFEDR